MLLRRSTLLQATRQRSSTAAAHSAVGSRFSRWQVASVDQPPRGAAASSSSEATGGLGGGRAAASGGSSFTSSSAAHSGASATPLSINDAVMAASAIINDRRSNVDTVISSSGSAATLLKERGAVAKRLVYTIEAALDADLFSTVDQCLRWRRAVASTIAAGCDTDIDLTITKQTLFGVMLSVGRALETVDSLKERKSSKVANRSTGAEAKAAAEDGSDVAEDEEAPSSSVPSADQHGSRPRQLWQSLLSLLRLTPDTAFSEFNPREWVVVVNGLAGAYSRQEAEKEQIAPRHATEILRALRHIELDMATPGRAVSVLTTLAPLLQGIKAVENVAALEAYHGLVQRLTVQVINVVNVADHSFIGSIVAMATKILSITAPFCPGLSTDEKRNSATHASALLAAIAGRLASSLEPTGQASTSGSLDEATSVSLLLRMQTLVALALEPATNDTASRDDASHAALQPVAAVLTSALQQATQRAKSASLLADEVSTALKELCELEASKKRALPLVREFIEHETESALDARRHAVFAAAPLLQSIGAMTATLRGAHAVSAFVDALEAPVADLVATFSSCASVENVMQRSCELAAADDGEASARPWAEEHVSFCQSVLRPRLVHLTEVLDSLRSAGRSQGEPWAMAARPFVTAISSFIAGLARDVVTTLSLPVVDTATLQPASAALLLTQTVIAASKASHVTPAATDVLNRSTAFLEKFGAGSLDVAPEVSLEAADRLRTVLVALLRPPATGDTTARSSTTADRYSTGDEGRVPAEALRLIGSILSSHLQRFVESPLPLSTAEPRQLGALIHRESVAVAVATELCALRQAVSLPQMEPGGSLRALCSERAASTLATGKLNSHLAVRLVDFVLMLDDAATPRCREALAQVALTGSSQEPRGWAVDDRLKHIDRLTRLSPLRKADHPLYTEALLPVVHQLCALGITVQDADDSSSLRGLNRRTVLRTASNLYHVETPTSKEDGAPKLRFEVVGDSEAQKTAALVTRAAALRGLATLAKAVLVNTRPSDSPSASAGAGARSAEIARAVRGLRRGLAIASTLPDADDACDAAAEAERAQTEVTSALKALRDRTKAAAMAELAQPQPQAAELKRDALQLLALQQSGVFVLGLWQRILRGVSAEIAKDAKAAVSSVDNIALSLLLRTNPADKGVTTTAALDDGALDNAFLNTVDLFLAKCSREVASVGSPERVDSSLSSADRVAEDSLLRAEVLAGVLRTVEALAPEPIDPRRSADLVRLASRHLEGVVDSRPQQVSEQEETSPSSAVDETSDGSSRALLNLTLATALLSSEHVAAGGSDIDEHVFTVVRNALQREVRRENCPVTLLSVASEFATVLVDTPACTAGSVFDPDAESLISSDGIADAFAAFAMRKRDAGGVSTSGQWRRQHLRTVLRWLSKSDASTTMTPRGVALFARALFAAIAVTPAEAELLDHVEPQEALPAVIAALTDLCNDAAASSGTRELDQSDDVQWCRVARCAWCLAAICGLAIDRNCKAVVGHEVFGTAAETLFRTRWNTQLDAPRQRVGGIVRASLRSGAPWPTFGAIGASAVLCLRQSNRCPTTTPRGGALAAVTVAGVLAGKQRFVPKTREQGIAALRACGAALVVLLSAAAPSVREQIAEAARSAASELRQTPDSEAAAGIRGWQVGHRDRKAAGLSVLADLFDGPAPSHHQQQVTSSNIEEDEAARTITTIADLGDGIERLAGHSLAQTEEAGAAPGALPGATEQQRQVEGLLAATITKSREHPAAAVVESLATLAATADVVLSVELRRLDAATSAQTEVEAVLASVPGMRRLLPSICEGLQVRAAAAAAADGAPSRHAAP